MTYRDRTEAGAMLAESLRNYAEEDACILGVARGGVVVAAEVARRLHLPLDVLVARKLGVPGSPELAFGAVGSGEVSVVDQERVEELGLSPDAIERVVELERRELNRRLVRYRRGEEPMDLEGRVAIVIDDGLGTGATMRAALETLRPQNPSRVVAAAPVGPPDVARTVARMVDELVCPNQPPEMASVSVWYKEYNTVDDEEVARLLDEYGARQSARRH